MTPWRKFRGRVSFYFMNLIILLIVLLLLFGGGGFYVGGPVFGGALGLILAVALIVYFLGGFRGRA